MPTERIDNTHLKKYVKKFTRAELMDFFRIIITGRLDGDLFISNSSSVNMWMKFNNECRKIDSSIPLITEKNSGYSNMTKDNPIYFFDYLSTKQIANIICDHIDNHCDVAEKLAKILYNSGYNAAHSYLIQLYK